MTGSEILSFRMLRATALTGSLAFLPFHAAYAQATKVAVPDVDTIIVTASRRSEDVTKIPYNISVLGSGQLERRGVANFEDLTRQIPNLNLNAAGNRTVGVQRPVMRGLNASSTNRQTGVNEQAPVATYLGNVPFGSLFAIDDVERVEVLRGPQGTLYGAGALGGAVRILPAAPVLGKFTGSVDGSFGFVNSSGKQDYSVGGVINIPLGDTLAFRASAKHLYEAGFVDRFGLFAREGGALSSPTLANPADPAGSSAVLRNVKDYNWSRTTSARAALKWEPVDGLEAVAAYNFTRFSGRGGPEDNPSFHGGPDPLDPTITYPDLDKYDVVIRSDEPYRRTSHMGSLDVSYDAGFATLSSTTSYTTSVGVNSPDLTYLYLSLPPGYQDYYVGNPRNPRFNGSQLYAEHSKVFTQEVRLVSNSGGAIDYVLGGYYQNEKRRDDISLLFPGQADYANAIGSFFNTGPNGEAVFLAGRDKFTDKAVFGDVTWHITPQWQITGGARVFWQKFHRDLSIDLFTFFLPSVQTTNSQKINAKAIFKANTSYEFAPNNNIYATFSQGFRRGGANSFATTGLIREDASVQSYAPDEVDNYEVGIKGRLAGGLRYTVALFWDEWTNPQIGLLTPVNRYAVVFNGKTARSRGVEVELNGNLSRDFSFSASYAFSDPKLKESFCIPTGTAVADPNSPEGNAIIDPCGIRGDKGSRLPGSAKHSANLGLLYSHDLENGDKLDIDLNTQFTGNILTSLPQLNLVDPPKLRSYWIVNSRVSFDHKAWQIALYGRNILNKRAILSKSLYFPDLVGPIDDIDTVNRPRQIGVELKFKW